MNPSHTLIPTKRGWRGSWGSGGARPPWKPSAEAEAAGTWTLTEGSGELRRGAASTYEAGLSRRSCGEGWINSSRRGGLLGKGHLLLRAAARRPLQSCLLPVPPQRAWGRGGIFWPPASPPSQDIPSVITWPEIIHRGRRIPRAGRGGEGSGQLPAPALSSRLRRPRAPPEVCSLGQQ